MPACSPVIACAGAPSDDSSSANTAHEIASPHASSRSRFGPLRTGPSSAASVSVAYGSGARPIAEHTTTGESPRRTASSTRDAAISRSSSVASEEPPNFKTTTFTVDLDGAFVIVAHPSTSSG